jgi:hypothetical protein
VTFEGGGVYIIRPSFSTLAKSYKVEGFLSDGTLETPFSFLIKVK